MTHVKPFPQTFSLDICLRGESVGYKISVNLIILITIEIFPFINT